MSLNEIIKDIVNYNKETQISTYIQFCNNDSSNTFCSQVDKNNYDAWFNFFSANNNERLFSKGRNRFETWIKLIDENVLYFSKKIIPTNSEQTFILTNLFNTLNNINRKTYFFILASLLIIFQVFGDGNHRTAKYFYKKATGNNISSEQETRINNLLRENDYNSISNDPIMKMNYIINELIQIMKSSFNGGKNIKRHQKKSKKIKKNKKFTRKPKKSKKFIIV